MPKLRLCQIPLIDVNDFDDLIPTFTLEQLIIDYCTMICLGKQNFIWKKNQIYRGMDKNKKIRKLNE